MAAYKIKTKRAAYKRYRVVGKGKVKVGRKNKRHLFSNKSAKRKRQLRGCRILGPADAPKALSLLPYL